MSKRMIAYMCVKKKQSLLNAFMLVLDHMLLLFVVYEKLAECVLFLMISFFRKLTLPFRTLKGDDDEDDMIRIHLQDNQIS